MELSFCDLRAKEVVNICDGRKLGNIIDLIIDCRFARVVGIVVPYDKGFFSFFKGKQDIFIPWNQICRIGKDVILVDISPSQLPEIYATKHSKSQNIGTLQQPQNSVIDLGYSPNINTNSNQNTSSENPQNNSYNPTQSNLNAPNSNVYSNPNYYNNPNQNNYNQNTNNLNSNLNNFNYDNFTKS